MVKKIKIFLIFLALTFLVSNSFGQEKLFIPRNINAAYEKGTRSLDGASGTRYWQNYSDYKIEVDINPSTNQLNGSEEIIYHNNSPDSLKRIVLRLYPNIYKKGSVRDYQIPAEAVDDGVSVRKIIVDGLSINLENQNIFRVQNALGTIYLVKPIPPKSFTTLSIDWSFHISDKARLREGAYDSTSAFIGYWYPQVSVYDDIDGWDYNNYNGQTEFYNDFSNFEVSICIPNRFGVWATGELQNPQDVLEKKILERYETAKGIDSVVRIITSDDLGIGPTFNNVEPKNTWLYKASNVTDFAFAFSDHYLWDGLTVTVDTLKNKSTFLQTIYPINSPDFRDVAKFGSSIVKYFTKVMPGIEYPSQSLVIFNNGRSGGGMEFPMMINNGSPDNVDKTVDLTSHEMAHQYFPFLVGTNEQKYAFMDEAWAVMLPFKYMEEFAGINSRLITTVGNYENLAGTEDDIPPMVSSLSLTYISYRNSAYNRTSIAYETLHNLLGDKLFLQALQKYIERWSGKHPTPYDFFFTFDEVSGQNLSWFWKPWFFDYGYPDLSIDKVESKNNKVFISIRKVGNVPTPIKLKLVYENESTKEIYYSAEVWKNNKELYKMEYELAGILKEIQLGDLTIPDSNRENNIYLVH